MDVCFVSGSVRVSRDVHAKRARGTTNRKGLVVCALSRREFVLSVGAAAAASALGREDTAARATGLKLFPLSEPLINRYFFLRAGQSMGDKEGVVRTNPVDKLSVQNGLTDVGEFQAVKAAELLQKHGAGPSGDDFRELWLWSGIEAKAMQTAELMMMRLSVRRENVMPEFSFLDARGMGAFEGQPVLATQEVVHSMDSTNHRARMTLGEDGTPNDSIEDVFVRMRQLLSKTETLYQNADIVFIGPDSYTLSVLECALRNDDLRNYNKYAYSPGELRLIEPCVSEPAARQYLTLADQ